MKTYREFLLLMEGQQEDLAIKILTQADKLDALDELKDIDPTDSNKYLPQIAYFYTQGANLNYLRSIFSSYHEHRVKKRLKALKHTKRGIEYDNAIIDFRRLSEIVHATDAKNIDLSNIKQSTDLDDMDKVWSNERYDIYLGDNMQKCIRLGDGTPFCISDKSLSSNMFNSYRLKDGYIFYFIFDKNPDTPNEKVTVIGVSHIHDAKNITFLDNDTHYGDDVEEYLNRNPNIPQKIFKPVPFTDKEKMIIEKFYDDDGNYIKKLEPHELENLTDSEIHTYIELGGIVNYEQFEFLNSKQRNKVINISGGDLNQDIVKNLSGKELKRYKKLEERYAEEYIKNETQHLKHIKLSDGSKAYIVVKNNTRERGIYHLERGWIHEPTLGFIRIDEKTNSPIVEIQNSDTQFNKLYNVETEETYLEEKYLSISGTLGIVNPKYTNYYVISYGNKTMIYDVENKQYLIGPDENVFRISVLKGENNLLTVSKYITGQKHQGLYDFVQDRYLFMKENVRTIEGRKYEYNNSLVNVKTETNKIGVYDTDNEKFILDVKYDNIKGYMENPVKIVLKKGETGIYDFEKMKFITDNDFDSGKMYTMITKNYFKLEKDNYYGLFSMEKTDFVLPVEYKKIQEVIGLQTFLVKTKDDKYGLWGGEKVEFSVEPEYDEIPLGNNLNYSTKYKGYIKAYKYDEKGNKKEEIIDVKFG